MKMMMIYASTQAAIAGLLGTAAAAPAAGNCSAPKLNQATISTIAELEGVRASVYKDQVGQDTIGIGHLCKQPGCAEVKYPMPLSDADSRRLLMDDTTLFEACITRAVSRPVTLNTNQYGALVSWAFNVGCDAARGSQLIRRLNAGQPPSQVARAELPKWNAASGQVLDGLINRRQTELRLFDTATGEAALPASGC